MCIRDREYSIDGDHFKALPNLELSKGKIAEAYMMEDASPALGSGFYRIKYVETDGHYVYSDNVPLIFQPIGTPDAIVHPNPFMDEMTINFLNPLLQDAEIIIVNNLGTVMEICSAAQGVSRMNVSCPNYPPGLYTVFIKYKREMPIVYRTLKVE